MERYAALLGSLLNLDDKLEVRSPDSECLAHLQLDTVIAAPLLVAQTRRRGEPVLCSRLRRFHRVGNETP